MHVGVGVLDNSPLLIGVAANLSVIRGDKGRKRILLTLHMAQTLLQLTVESQSVDLGQSNNPNTTPTKDYKNVQVVVCLRGVQRGCAEEGKRGSTPTG